METLPYSYQQRKFWEFYCPVCKVQTRSVYWPSPRPRHYASILMTGVMLTMVLWPFCGPKGLFLTFPIMALFEFIYRARARQSMICRRCGFDPYLYKYDVKMARQKVAEFFAQRQGELSSSAPAAPTESKKS